MRYRIPPPGTAKRRREERKPVLVHDPDKAFHASGLNASVARSIRPASSASRRGRAAESEPANFSRCLYPTEVEWEYTPEDDQRFEATPKDGSGWSRFSWDKWLRHCKREQSFTRSPAAFNEVRNVPTKLTGWYWRSFSKTQYASNPECGGVPNFLRCHISVITLLERMAKLTDLKVTIDDEGKYGPSTYSDDWKEAYEEGRKPTYTWHKGKYSPVALANEVGEWNWMIAGFSGALNDTLAGSGVELEAPIKDFANFEQLEFKGQNLKYLEPFLKAMKTLSFQCGDGASG